MLQDTALSQTMNNKEKLGNNDSKNQGACNGERVNRRLLQVLITFYFLICIVRIKMFTLLLFFKLSYTLYTFLCVRQDCYKWLQKMFTAEWVLPRMRVEADMQPELLLPRPYVLGQGFSSDHSQRSAFSLPLACQSCPHTTPSTRDSAPLSNSHNSIFLFRAMLLKL